VILYGNTKTTQKDVILTAPSVELDQKSGIITAFNTEDSLGNAITRARFEQGENQFESDTIRFNFKTQKGYTTNTFTQQDEIFVHGRTIKKVNENTLFISDGRFSTCNLEEPHFHFETKRMKVVNNKVAVTGYVQLAFEDVPIPKPVGLPFGIFPLSRGRHSGMLQPRFTVTEDIGIGLENLGYYHVLNDYLDVMVRANVYSYGSWMMDVQPSYRKRYRYNGSFNVGLMRTKVAFKGDPDYTNVKSFKVTWTHTMDQRARPGMNFSASVNASSTRHNRYVLNDPHLNIQNKQQSSIAYSKTWIGTPFSISLAANHYQDNNLHSVNMQLPTGSFNMTTIYPFERKEIAGSKKWYENLGIGYQTNFRNNFAFYDTAAISLQQILDTLEWDAGHNLPITLALPPLGPIKVSPSISYQERWTGRRRNLEWKGDRVETVYEKGFYTARNVSTGLSLSTAMFGTANFRNSRLAAIRHVIRPDVSFSYTPSLASSYYDTVTINQNGTIQEYSMLQGGFSNRDFGGISFTLNNNVEAKWRGKKDTALRKIRILDNFGFSGGYNFLLDSQQLTPLRLFLNSSLFDKINLSANATLVPYVMDSFFRQTNEVRLPGTITNANITLSTQFRSKPRDPSKTPETMERQPQITDPTLLADQQRLTEYMQRNPHEFVDFNIPWDISLDFGFTVYRRAKADFSGVETETTSNLNFRNSFSLTPKWNFSTYGYYDIKNRELSQFSMSINRDLHCWQMSIAVTPIGLWSYFSISISPKSSLLQDLKVNRTRTFTNY
jgi:hypothetical protein